MDLLPCEEHVIGYPTVHHPRVSKDWAEQCRREIDAVRKGDKGRIYVSSFGALRDADALESFNACDATWFHGGDYDSRELEDLIRRLGIAALPGLLSYADGKLASAHLALSIVVSPRVAPYLAQVLAKGKKKDRAESWFLEHPEVASIGLIPVVLDKKKTVREPAVAALRFLASTGHRNIVASIADRYGIRSTVDALLEDDAPKAKIALPKWLAPKKLDSPFDAERTLEIVALLQHTSTQVTASGLVEAKKERSLAALAWSLFEQWSAAGENAKDEWALYALGHLGDDTTIEQLLPRIGRWQSTGASLRAARAMEVLTLIGTDLAFLHLDHIARKGRTRKLRQQAGVAVERIAARMGLSTDDLEDRRAPDLGLDERGRIDLDFEGWSLTLDERLRPCILDPDGNPAAKLPRGAPAQILKTLKKQAGLVAESQVARFERALVARRSWSAEAFMKFVIAHPLLRVLARRLVWIDDNVTFRVAEDGTLATLEDRAYEVRGTVRIAHTLDIDAVAWSQVFADYEIIQPFPQLGRSIYAMDDREKDGTTIVRFSNRETTWDRVLALGRNGFDGHGGQSTTDYTRAMPFDVSIHVALVPGVSRADPREAPDQKIVSVTVGKTISALTPIEYSEILYALKPLAPDGT